MVIDLMIHDIDIVLGLVDGEPRKVTAMGASGALGLADVANVQIVFDGGTMATITASRATREESRHSWPSPQPDAYIVLDYHGLRTSRSTGGRRLYREPRGHPLPGRPFVRRAPVRHKDTPSARASPPHGRPPGRPVGSTGRVELPEEDLLGSPARRAGGQSG